MSLALQKLDNQGPTLLCQLPMQAACCMQVIGPGKCWAQPEAMKVTRLPIAYWKSCAAVCSLPCLPAAHALAFIVSLNRSCRDPDIG